jgi:hypothetical protein
MDLRIQKITGQRKVTVFNPFTAVYGPLRLTWDATIIFRFADNMTKLVLVILCDQSVTIFSSPYLLNIIIDQPGQVPVKYNIGEINYAPHSVIIDVHFVSIIVIINIKVHQIQRN